MRKIVSLSQKLRPQTHFQTVFASFSYSFILADKERDICNISQRHSSDCVSSVSTGALSTCRPTLCLTREGNERKVYLKGDERNLVLYCGSTGGLKKGPILKKSEFLWTMNHAKLIWW